jgi:hypothetical protein
MPIAWHYHFDGAVSDGKRGPRQLPRAFLNPGPRLWRRLHHVVAAHAAAGGAAAAVVVLRLRLVGDEGFRRQDEGTDGRGVLERRAGDLERLDDAGRHHVDEVAGYGVEALTRLGRLHAVHFDAAFETGVLRDLAGHSNTG